MLATGNSGKFLEMEAILREGLGISSIGLGDLGLVGEPEEDGLSFVANARLKAEYWFSRARLPTLADDSGLVIPCLEGWPGIHSARIAKADRDRRALVLETLGKAGFSYELESTGVPAWFECALVLKAPEKEWIAEGRLHGVLKLHETGTEGFGYDPIFYLPDSRSLANRPPAQKNSLSHRSLALQSLMKKMLAE